MIFEPPILVLGMAEDMAEDLFGVRTIARDVYRYPTHHRRYIAGLKTWYRPRFEGRKRHHNRLISKMYECDTFTRLGT